MYRPLKKPRKICVFTLCNHSPPNLMVWLPCTIEKLSRISVCQKSSSDLGSWKKGWPTRNESEEPNEPIEVSGTLDGLTAERGRFSREYVKCASFSLVAEIVLNQFVLMAWILDG